MSERFAMAVFFPLLSMLIIAIYAGGVGVAFMVLYDTPMKEYAVIILGVTLVVVIPLIALILQNRVEKR